MPVNFYNPADDPANKLMVTLGLDPKKVVRMHILFDPDSPVIVRVEFEPDDEWVEKLCDTVKDLEPIIVERKPCQP